MRPPARLLRHHVLLIAIVGVVLFANLGGPRLWDRDEPRNAGCALEMLARGDWVTPHFNGMLRTHKPVLLYWLMMTAYTVFGENEFAARFWSAALSVGTCLCTYHLGRRLFSPAVGIWAAVILCTTIMFDIAARAATPDAVLIFCSTLALTIYVLGVFPDRAKPSENDEPFSFFPRRKTVIISMYVAIGLATLAKGPVGLLLPMATIGMFLLIMRLPSGNGATSEIAWQGRVRRAVLGCMRPFHPLHFLKTCWVMRPLTGLAVIAVVAAPWYIWVGLRTDGEWLRGFFLEHNIGRATSTMEGHSGSMFFYYPLVVLIGFFPWSSFAGPVLIEIKRRLHQRDAAAPALIFLCCWVGVYVGLFSIAQTKLPSYITPCYPALALLTGSLICRWIAGCESVGRRWLAASLITPVVVGAAMIVGLAIFLHKYLPGDEMLALIGLIPLIGGVAALACAKWRRRQWAAQSFAAMAVCFCLAIFAFGLQRVDRYQESHRLFDRISAAGDDAVVISYNRLEATWVYYLGQSIHEYPANEADKAAAFLASNENAFLITTAEKYENLRPILSSQIEVLEEVPYFLQGDERLVLLGHPTITDRTARSTDLEDTSQR